MLSWFDIVYIENKFMSENCLWNRHRQWLDWHVFTYQSYLRSGHIAFSLSWHSVYLICVKNKECLPFYLAREYRMIRHVSSLLLTLPMIFLVTSTMWRWKTMSTMTFIWEMGMSSYLLLLNNLTVISVSCFHHTQDCKHRMESISHLFQRGWECSWMLTRHF